MEPAAAAAAAAQTVVQCDQSGIKRARALWFVCMCPGGVSVLRALSAEAEAIPPFP